MFFHQNRKVRQQLPSSFSTDKYIYVEHYEYYKRDCNEKICAALVAQNVGEKLRDYGLGYQTPQQVFPVVDIGSGPADSIIMYLDALKHWGRFDLHVIDQNPAYTGPHGAAHQNLSTARALLAGEPNVVHANAFDGNLIRHLRTKANIFHLAFLSHVLYHTDMEHLRLLLQDVSKYVLIMEGVGILFHLEAKQDTFQYFRRKYGKQQTVVGSLASGDTPMMDIDNPPEAVERVCHHLNIPCYTSSYTNHYYFAPMEDIYWELFKFPERYSEITDKAARDNLHKLYFIVQRAPTEFATDARDETRLDTFLEEVRNVLTCELEKFTREGSFMELGETVQLIGSMQANEKTRAKLKAASEAIQTELPDLAQCSFAKKWGE